MNESASAANSRPRFVKNRWLRRLCYLLLLLSVAATIFILTQYRDVPLSVAKQAEIFDAPLTSDGQVDYLKAFEKYCYSSAMPTDENGFRMIIERVDFGETLPPNQFREVCQKLGLEGDRTKPNLKFVDPVDFASEFFASEKLDVAEFIKQDPFRHWLDPDETDQDDLNVELLRLELSSLLTDRAMSPWTDKDLPMMSRWVNRNAPALDLVAEAVRQPAFEIPFACKDGRESILETTGYHIQMLRGFARGFKTRANYFLGKGEVRKALDDIVSCKRLGRHVRNGFTSVDRALGIAIDGVADSTGVVNVQSPKTTSDDLKYFVEELAKLPQVKDFETVRLHSKLKMIEYLKRISTRQIARWKYSDQTDYLRSLGLNWNIVAEESAELIDQHWNNDEFEPMVELPNREWISRAARSRRFAKWMARSSLLVTLLGEERREQCSDRLRDISVAMLRYEMDHGSLPPAFTTDSNGQPLHSWRVLLLPYLGQKELYSAIRLDEPWNSSHNSQFADQCPTVFACPSCKVCGSQNTGYSVVLGEGLPFSGSKKKTLSSFGPFCDDMILIVERTQTVPWMVPDQELLAQEAERGIKDIEEVDKAELKLGSEHPIGANFGFRNGAIDFLSTTESTEKLKEMLRGTNQNPFGF